MRILKCTLALLVIGFALALAPRASAQVSIGIGIGRSAPACPYGYYGYAPYRCAPYGYYGPEWFGGGTFIGAGPWYHGDRYYGHVNRAYDPRYGYRGGYPGPGAYSRDGGHDFHDFHGSHYSDVRGRYHTEAQHQHYNHR
jgi:hypothetical protein